MIACNDYILLECCIYRLLKFHFAGASNYPQILDLFLEVSHLQLKEAWTESKQECAYRKRGFTWVLGSSR